MNAPRKFLFDTTFGPDEPNGGPREAKKVFAKSFSEAELNQARADGYAAGEEAGRKAAEEAIARDIDQTLTRATQQLAEIGKAQSEAIERRGRDAIEVAVVIIRKLFPSLTDRHGMTEIETVIGNCLAHLRSEPRVVIRVADSLLDALNERIKGLAAKAGFDGKLVLIAQDDLTAGDVRVEWADGGAERDNTLLWQEVDTVLARVFGAKSPKSAGPTPIDSTSVVLSPESDRPRAVSQ